jgi:hypothetical protein
MEGQGAGVEQRGERRKNEGQGLSKEEMDART